jgi:peptidoglycan/LPS O-acetylase OafA/YrhL
VLCVGKAAVSADGGVPLHPTWGTIWLSAANVPFLLGVLTYEVRGRGLEYVRLAAPVAAPALLAIGRIVPRQVWGLMVQGAACALVVSWCAATRQLPVQNPFVRYGDWTYGLYLIHYVALMAVLGNGPRQGWLPLTSAAAVATGLFVLAFSLAFGYTEAALYGWLRARFLRRRAPVVLRLARAA